MAQDKESTYTNTRAAREHWFDLSWESPGGRHSNYSHSLQKSVDRGAWQATSKVTRRIKVHSEMTWSHAYTYSNEITSEEDFPVLADSERFYKETSARGCCLWLLYHVISNSSQTYGLQQTRPPVPLIFQEVCPVHVQCRASRFIKIGEIGL